MIAFPAATDTAAGTTKGVAMKYNALMYYGQKYFGFEELEMPACGENDMIVKNLTASICG